MSAIHAADRHERHTCGGTILTGGAGEQAHRYCDQCGAYAYSGPVPSGTDKAANKAAWDNGDDASPAAKSPAAE